MSIEEAETQVVAEMYAVELCKALLAAAARHGADGTGRGGLEAFVRTVQRRYTPPPRPSQLLQQVGFPAFAGKASWRPRAAPPAAGLIEQAFGNVPTRYRYCRDPIMTIQRTQ
jgi:hypothetical protein